MLSSILLATALSSTAVNAAQGAQDPGLGLSLRFESTSPRADTYDGATILIENHGTKDIVIQELFGSSSELRFYARDSKGELVRNLDFGGIDGGMALIERLVHLRPGFVYGSRVKGVRLEDPGTYTIWCVLTKPDLTAKLGGDVWHGRLSSNAATINVRPK